MQRVVGRCLFTGSMLWAGSALAFAPDDSNVVQQRDLRPATYMALGRASDSNISGSSENADGTVTFLGRTALPTVRENFAASDTIGNAVISFFRNDTGEGELELKEISRLGEGNEMLIVLVQTVGGVPVIGTHAMAQLSGGDVQFGHQFLVAPPKLQTEPAIGAASAIDLAERDVRGFAKDAKATGSPTLAIFFIEEDAKLVWQVRVSSVEPNGSWWELIDAQSGAFVTRQKASLDAVSGTVSAPYEPMCQGDSPVIVPLPYVQWARGRATNGQGRFQSPQNITQANVMLNGAYFRIVSNDGRRPAWSIPLDRDGDNDLVLEDAPLSQTDPYVFANQARTWLRERAATVRSLSNSRMWSWTMGQLPINANFPSGAGGYRCNAFYDGSSLNFYQPDGRAGCLNSGRSAKIVYHEYGHGIHDHLTAGYNTFDGQVSEGVADYVMATMTNDPNVTGLMGCDSVLRGRNTYRTCVNQYTYCRSSRCKSQPGDEPHNSAPIICGALWELRDQLRDRYGEETGTLKADQIFLRFLTLVTDMNSSYAAAIAADEDNDGNPANGTTHSCEINKAFIGNPGGFAHFPDAVGRRVPCKR